DQLIISEELPSSLDVLQEIADLKKLDSKEIKTEFSKEELEFLEDIEIFPNLYSDDYQYFNILDTDTNASYLEKVENVDSEVQLGAEFPLVVLEKTGIWYTNMPKLAQTFLIKRGVTPLDIEKRSYHLWLVLNALDKLNSAS